ncbi:MAG: hypothetical protein ACK518_00565, partial [bacterium]
MSTVKFIHGPVSLTEHYSKEYDKHIYIFGDIHFNQLKPCQTKSMHIIDFMLNYARWNYQTNKRKTDIFLETAKLSIKDNPEYPLPGGSRDRNYLTDCVYFFQNFLRGDKSKVEDQFGVRDAIRVHYTDVRTLINKKGLGIYLSRSLNRLTSLPYILDLNELKEIESFRFEEEKSLLVDLVTNIL